MNNCIDRTKLSEFLSKWPGKESDLFLMLCEKSTKAREKFGVMYRRKAVENWTQVERENTLGYMLGYNIIRG